MDTHNSDTNSPSAHQFPEKHDEHNTDPHKSPSSKRRFTPGNFPNPPEVLDVASSITEPELESQSQVIMTLAKRGSERTQEELASLDMFMSNCATFQTVKTEYGSVPAERLLRLMTIASFKEGETIAKIGIDI